MKQHILKTWPDVFHAVITGNKTFEVRKNDREFEVGDHVKLIEYDAVTSSYTGRETTWFEIVYILQGGQFGIEEGHVAMQLKPVLYFNHG